MITLPEIVQFSIELVARAEKAEARVRELEAALQKALAPPEPPAA